MKTTLLILSFFLFIGCSSIQVQTDYDPQVDLKPLNTFVVLERTQKGRNTLTEDRITRALEEVFTVKHYVNVKQKKADFFVIYHIDVQNKTRIDTDYQSMGLYPYGYGGAMIATSRTVDYKEGRLIIDIMNPKTKKIIWRGMAVDQIKSFKTPQERNDYIKKVVEKILKTFPKNL